VQQKNWERDGKQVKARLAPKKIRRVRKRTKEYIKQYKSNPGGANPSGAFFLSLYNELLAPGDKPLAFGGGLVVRAYRLADCKCTKVHVALYYV
jgi:hypothetical protein